MRFTKSLLHRAGLGLLALLPLSHAACLDAGDDALTDPDDEVAALEEAITPPANACVFGDLIKTPTWANIPVFLPSLEIHTCDVANADTGDDVQVRFQVAGKLYSYWLDNPANDFERNHTDTFYFPTIGGALTQLRDLQAIHLQKSGTNAWCIDRLALKAAGVTIWQYATSETHPGTALQPNSGNGALWLDGQSADAPAPYVLFSDKQIKYDDRSHHGPLDLEITTCNDGPAVFGSSVRVKWTHDGIIEPPAGLVVDNPVFEGPGPPLYRGNVRTRGSVEVHRLADDVAIESLDSMRLETSGDGGNWCVGAVKVRANGHVVFQSQPHATIDGDPTKGKWVGLDLMANPKIVETGTHVGKLGRPISGANFVGATDVGFTVNSSERPFCDPPATLTHQALEGMIASIAVPKMMSKGAYWGGSGTVEVTKKSADTVHVYLRFEHDAPGAGNAKMWNNFDVQVKCGDPDPTNDDDAERALMLVPGTMHPDYDAPLLAEIGAWFKSIDIGKEVAKSMPSLKAQVFPVPGTCPTRTISANGDIHFDWPDQRINNAMCAIKASNWATVVSCLPRWGLAKK